MSTETLEAKPQEILNAIPSGPPITSVDAVSVDLLQDCVRVVYSNGFTKLVSFEDFVNSVSSVIGKKTEDKTSKKFLLPGGVFYFEVGSTSINIACYYPGCVRDVNFMGEVEKRITPNIIIYFKLKKGSMKGNKEGWEHESTIYTCTDLSLADVPREFINKPKHSARIYLLPFSNMYGTGQMCTGQNQLPRSFKGSDLRSLNWHFEMVWSSPFNTDLGLRALKDTWSRDVAKWFKHLSTIAKNPNPEFPYKEISGWKSLTSSSPEVTIPISEPSPGRFPVDEDIDF